MAGGSPHLFEIVVLPTGADALLRRGRSLEGAFLRSQKNALELDHAGIREKQRRIVLRNEGRTGLDGVASSVEEFEETRSDFSCGHGACHWASLGAHYNDITGSTQNRTRPQADVGTSVDYAKKPGLPAGLSHHTSGAPCEAEPYLSGLVQPPPLTAASFKASSKGASEVSSTSGSSPRPSESRTRASTSSNTSGFSMRKSLAFSFPCPRRRSP